MDDANVSDRTFAHLRGFLRMDERRALRPTSGRSRGVRHGAFAGVRARTDAQPIEECELCSLGLLAAHRHLLETSTRKVVCACDSCALRFENVVGGRYKTIPRDAVRLEDFSMTDERWAALAVPINLVFIYYDSALGMRTAMYPSPAGVTESLLPLDAWQGLAARNPVISGLEDDVEALLINRLQPESLYFMAPIDACYELAGLIRVHWRGLSGGEEVWEQVAQFFQRLRKASRHA